MNIKKEGVITFGLFGTCGNSTWRNDFMSAYDYKGMAYFNPQVPDWDPSLAVIEAKHLVSDEIILFPVTDETYGFGSLGEVGFSINQAIRANDTRFVIIYVAPTVSEQLQLDNPVASKESNRARALILDHMKEQAHLYPNVFMAKSLENMFDISIQLYKAMGFLKVAKDLCK